MRWTGWVTTALGWIAGRGGRGQAGRAGGAVGRVAAAGRTPATVVGHDWGGIVAWWLALRHPGRLERLVVLNAPPPEAFRRDLVRHPGPTPRGRRAAAAR